MNSDAQNPRAPFPSGIRFKDEARPGEVLIIGAGPGGLAAALLLAHAGLPVRILERQARVGGRMAAIEAKGFRFDTGPTFFHYTGILDRIFRSIGRRLEDEIPMTRLDPLYRMVFGNGDQELECTPDRERMRQTIARIAPADAKNLDQYFTDHHKKFAALAPIIENAPSDLKDWRSLFEVAKVLHPWNSFDQELRKYFSNDKIRQAFSFQAKYLGMSPFKCPSIFSFLSYIEYEYGVFHPTGGCAAISEAMARIAQEMGVIISLGEDVQELLFDGRRAVGVRTNRGEYKSDTIVVNADFARAMTRLVPNHLRKKWSNERIAKKQFSCSTFMMYLGVEGRYDDVTHHTIRICDDPNGHLEQIRTGELPPDPSFYVQNASVTDPTLAPRGHSTLYVLVPVSNQSNRLDWRREQASFRALVLEKLKTIGIEDVEARIRYEKILTPIEWDVCHEVHLGATFNLAHTLDQMLHFRPKNRFDELEGVYLVGGGTHPGSGLPLIFEGARVTSRLLLRDKNMDTRWFDQEALPVRRGAPASVRRVG